MKVPASGTVLTRADKAAMVEVIERGWLTAGPVNAEFERKLAEFTGAVQVRTCNSGSSANLLAVAALVESGRWKAGDCVITTAACFPTTVNPLLLYGLVPVFVDVDAETLNAIPDQVWASSKQARGVMMAHTLGNPFDAQIREIARDRGLALVEDCADALGATYEGRASVSGLQQHVGTDCDLATCSFFPAHHITTGEGGAVFGGDPELIRKVESVRDWGRDCWCAPGENNSCGKRFEQQHGELPYGYDHKTVTTALGFNLKLTDVQAACGLAQLALIDDIVSARRRNYTFLAERLSTMADRLSIGRATAGSNPSWFGFPITLREPGLRNAMQAWLSDQGVDSRSLFAGNITRQPYMKGRKFLTAASLVNTDKVMEDMFWIGCHPQLSEEQLDYAASKVREFLEM